MAFKFVRGLRSKQKELQYFDWERANKAANAMRWSYLKFSWCLDVAVAYARPNYNAAQLLPLPLPLVRGAILNPQSTIHNPQSSPGNSASKWSRCWASVISGNYRARFV